MNYYPIVDFYLLSSVDYNLVSITSIDEGAIGSLLQDLSNQSEKPINLIVLDQGSKIIVFR